MESSRSIKESIFILNERLKNWGIGIKIKSDKRTAENIIDLMSDRNRKQKIIILRNIQWGLRIKPL